MILTPLLRRVEKAYKAHPQADVLQLDTLKSRPHPHALALCNALLALIHASKREPFYAIVEPELAPIEVRAVAETLVCWTPSWGILVTEVRNHTLEEIVDFERTGVPVIASDGTAAQSDPGLVRRPAQFARLIHAVLAPKLEQISLPTPPVRASACLPHVERRALIEQGHEVPEQLLFADDLDAEALPKRLSRLRNFGEDAHTDQARTLEQIRSLFGDTSGLRSRRRRRRETSPPPDSEGAWVRWWKERLKRLTSEQRQLAFAPALLNGPIVIRGVAGSGKTVVLANAVAEAFLRELDAARQPELFPDPNRVQLHVLVLSFNRVLARHLETLIRDCFERRRRSPQSAFPERRLTVLNIDRYAYRLARELGLGHYDPTKPRAVEEIVAKLICALEAEQDNHGETGRFTHILIDEGQDMDLAWYPLLRALCRPNRKGERPIIVFYDEAQNLYARRLPGVGGAPPWRELLGSVPRPRGLRTVMRVCHRNTEQILQFSFALLLGTFAERDPRMAQFANLSSYEKETIPTDPDLAHPHADEPCVVKRGPRRYELRFAIHQGPAPKVHAAPERGQLLERFGDRLAEQIDPKIGGVNPEDILIVAPYRQELEAIADLLEKRRIAYHFVPKHRDDDPFQPGRVSVSTIKMSKGYTAPVCHVLMVDTLPQPTNASVPAMQGARAQLHVACTRASVLLDLWGLRCPLMDEAQQARDELPEHAEVPEKTP